MEIQVKLRELSARIVQLRDKIQTEEATKTAFVLPFLQLLGYDIFNPTEVHPEFTADIGLKKGEKVDYAISIDSEPIIIMECKNWSEKLDLHNSQLFRYFHVTKARFAVLTNGIEYRFYTDLDEKNKMDERPFLEVNLLELRENDFSELSKFKKENFDVDRILTTASALKFSKEIKRVFSEEIANSSDDFVKFFASRIYSGRITAAVLEQFRELVGKAIQQSISEKVNERLKFALTKENEQQKVEKIEPEPIPISEIETTQDEMQGFYIVKGILLESFSPERIVFRDAKTYFSIILDDNNRKPVCRLYLNGKTWQVGLFDSDKNETKHLISSLQEIYSFKEQLLSAAMNYN